MLFKLMKEWEKIVFYEFNMSFAFIFHKWKMALNNLTLQAYQIDFHLQYLIHSYILYDFTFKLYFIFSENVIN